MTITIPQWTKRSAETSTLLAANAVATGASHDTSVDGSTVGHYARFRAVVVSDQVGSLVVQQSADGTNWYPTTTAVTTTANAGTIVESMVGLQYVRAVHTNGGTLQTKFVFSTVLIAV